MLDISYSSTENIKYLSLFRGEIVVINTEFSLYLNPPILKGGVYPIGQ